MPLVLEMSYIASILFMWLVRGALFQVITLCAYIPGIFMEQTELHGKKD
jgi:hypothetical protein